MTAATMIIVSDACARVPRSPRGPLKETHVVGTRICHKGAPIEMKTGEGACAIAMP